MDDVLRDDTGRVIWMRRSNCARRTEFPGPGSGRPRAEKNTGMTPAHSVSRTGDWPAHAHNNPDYSTPGGRSR